MTSILLASASQRRYDWLCSFLTDDESKIESRPLISPEPAPSNGIDVRVQTEATCIAKANAAASEMTISGDSHDLVIVADTLVEDPEDPLIAMGKPGDVVSATAMLLRLSGRRHRVWSSTALLWPPTGRGMDENSLTAGWRTIHEVEVPEV